MKFVAVLFAITAIILLLMGSVALGLGYVTDINRVIVGTMYAIVFALMSITFAILAKKQ
jgi:hypothetical protein